MSRLSTLLLAVVFVATAPLAGAANTTSANTLSAQQPDGLGVVSPSVSPDLIGVWSATPDRQLFTTEFEWSVWGRNAASVRETVLTVQPSGAGLLTVTKKVLNARGRVQSTTVEEARLLVSGVQETTASRIEHAVKVVNGERKYSDGPQDTWPLEGLRVRVVSLRDTPSLIEVRFETSEGPGSFWETLRRQSRRPPQRQ